MSNDVLYGGVIGIGGVVLGALLTFWLGSYAERKKDRGKHRTALKLLLAEIVSLQHVSAEIEDRVQSSLNDRRFDPALLGTLRFDLAELGSPALMLLTTMAYERIVNVNVTLTWSPELVAHEVEYGITVIGEAQRNITNRALKEMGDSLSKLRSLVESLLRNGK